MNGRNAGLSSRPLPSALTTATPPARVASTKPGTPSSESPRSSSGLRHQLSIAHVHEEEVKEDLEAMKERLRKSGAEGGRSIRDSEDR